MTTRSIQFFMRTAEFASLAAKAASDLRLAVILVRRGRDRQVELGSEHGLLTMSDGAPADWVFLARSAPDVGTIDPNDLRAPEWGWLDCDMPREVDGILYKAQVAAKSDWYDPDSRMIRHNPDSVALFTQVAPRLRARLRRPVWAHNILGGEAKPYKSIGYSEGAAEWVRHGGELRQEGVRNIRYTLREPA